MKTEHLCPICGKYMFEELDSYDICDVCGWEDNSVQEDHPDEDYGPNGYSLNEYKSLYENGKLDFQLEGKISYDEDEEDEEDPLVLAYRFSTNHRKELEKDNICGCFECLRIFSPKEIIEWVPEQEDGECVTAICPYCDIDSVIGESSGFPITKEFLQAMQKRWMG